MLFRKMLRDMGQHRTQFISIFIMAFLGVFIYAGISSEWMGLKRTVTDYYSTTNFADVWLYGQNFTAADETAAAAVRGVTGTERSLVVDGVGKFGNSPKITLNFVEKGQISQCCLISGEPFSTEKDGIWIDDRFASAHGLKVGDTMSVTAAGITLEKMIVGTMDNPEYIYLSDGEGMTPDFSANGYAYLSSRAFPNPSALVYNRMLLTTEKDPAKLEDAVGSALGGKDSVYLIRKNHPSYAMFQQEIDQHRSMGSIFPVAFLLIALLTILTTMTRIVANQRTQIGTLKSLGFQKSRITRHYVGYGFWVSLAGSLAGAVVGPLTLPHLFYPALSGFYTLPRWQAATDVSFYIMAAVMVALCTLVTYLACRKALQNLPAKLLRPKAPKASRHGIFEKLAVWKRLGFHLQWNIRDILRSRIRSVMAFAGVLGCTALLVCALGLYDDMNDMKNWQYHDLIRYQSKLSVDDAATPAQITDALSRTDGQAVMEAPIEIKAGGGKKTGSLTVTDQVTLQKNTDKTRNLMELPADGVSLSYKMAQNLGVKKGDIIRWHLYGSSTWVTTPVKAVYRDPATQGITLTRNAFEKLGFVFRTTSILSPQKVLAADPGIAGIQHIDKLLRDWDNQTQAMMTMVYVLIAAASLLAVVVLYNLGILSFTEMERELATLKVTGFTSGKIRRLLLTQNLILAAFGFVFGIPAGKWLIDAMVTTMGDSFDMITVIHPGNILISLGIVLFLSFGVSFLFAPRIRRLDMVGALKSVE